MDPLKVIIFVVAFLLLLPLGRKLFTTNDIHAYQPPEPAQPMAASQIVEEETGSAP